MNDFVEGDTGAVLQVTCTDQATGAVINLTGSTVALKWEDKLGAVVSKAMTVSAPLTGVCTYQFGVDELYAPGMSFEVVITNGSAKTLSNVELIAVSVRTKF